MCCGLRGGLHHGYAALAGLVVREHLGPTAENQHLPRRAAQRDIDRDALRET